MVCVKKKWKGQILYHNTPSKLVMWLEIKLKTTVSSDKKLLVGNIYIPPSGSPYADADCFNEVEAELDELVLNHNVHVCLAGDFNARTGGKSEFMLPNEFEDDDFIVDPELYDKLSVEQEMLDKGIPLNRVTQDKTVNEYGNRLFELCQNNALYVCNGRVGMDAVKGKTTSKDTSIIDYVVCSPAVLCNVLKFEVLEFDHLFSDIHCALSVCIEMYQAHASNRRQVAPEQVAPPAECGDTHDKKIIWDQSKVDQFKTLVEAFITDRNLEDITDVNILCNNVSSVFHRAAKEVFKSTCITCKQNESPTTNQVKNTKIPKPWFDEVCKQKRRHYKFTKNRYKNSKSLEDLVAMRNANKSYKRQIRISVNKHKRLEIKKLRNLKTSNTKKYWDILNGKKKQTTVKASLEDLFEHFKDLNTDVEGRQLNPPDVNVNPEIDGVLNREICTEDITRAIKKIKNNKACGMDNILNEYLKCTLDVMAPFYVQLFNGILNTGDIPDSWLMGKIIPIFKNNGSETDPSNYRGITLLSCLGKVFTSIINDRLAEVVQLNENQAGFRHNYSTSDHVFVIKSIVDIFLSQNKKLFCAFIDYSKAFDSIWRAGLWYKVVQSGVCGKVLDVLKNMYQNVKSCVMVNGKCSEFFNSQIGVRQGENLSPMLFAMYVNDLEKYLIDNGCQPLQFGDENLNNLCNILVLMYADDTILISDTQRGLQHQLNCLNNYCKLWKLNVNETKTKVIVFSKRKYKLKDNILFDGKVLESVDEFKYLGVTFSTNGRFVKCKTERVKKAQRAMFSVIKKSRAKHLPIDVQLHLFDSMVMPVLIYGCEIWGYEKVEPIEKLQLKFFRYILHLKNSTPICMMRGELGKMPIECEIQKRLINFWAKLIDNTSSKLSSKMYKVLHSMYTTGGFSSLWVQNIERILNNCGLGYVFQEQCSYGDNWLKEIIKQNVKDQYAQKWSLDVNNSSKCSTYRLFKTSFEFEKYLVKLPYPKYTQLCRFRTTNHKLPIEIGRYRNIPRAERHCTLCDQGTLGDEFHFILACPALNALRERFIPRKFRTRPNVIKFGELFNSCNHSTMVKLQKYIHLASAFV